MASNLSSAHQTLIASSASFLTRVRTIFTQSTDSHLFSVGQSLQLPLPPVSIASNSPQAHRFDANTSNGVLNVVYRNFYDELIPACERDSVYLTGSIGAGKSFCLYYLYCRLSADPSSRVIYLNDCYRLTTHFAAHIYLRHVIVSAFAQDEGFLSSISKCREMG